MSSISSISVSDMAVSSMDLNNYLDQMYDLQAEMQADISSQSNSQQFDSEQNASSQAVGLQNIDPNAVKC